MGRKRKLPPNEENILCSFEKPPIVRNTANERERERMRVLSRAFAKLKTTLPWVPPDTKLSKLDTLRLATCYIAHLRQVLAEDSTCNGTPSQPHLDLAMITSFVPENGLKFASPPQNQKMIVSTTSPNSLHPVALMWPYTTLNAPARVTSLDPSVYSPCSLVTSDAVAQCKLETSAT